MLLVFSFLHLIICQGVENLLQVGRHLALSRVAPKFPVDDLARLAAVAPRVAAAADGEGGLIVSRESAADIAYPTPSPSKFGARPSVTI